MSTNVSKKKQEELIDRIEATHKYTASAVYVVGDKIGFLSKNAHAPDYGLSNNALIYLVNKVESIICLLLEYSQNNNASSSREFRT
jgi:hypothetical protein